MTDIKKDLKRECLDYDMDGNKTNCGLIGLVNLGNTCYMNTVIQCLVHTLPLKDLFMNDNYKKHLNEESRNRIFALQWENLVNHMWNPKKGISSLCPKNFVRLNQVISQKMVKDGKLTSSFRIGEQHDMAEYLQFVLDIIHDSLSCQVSMNSEGNIRTRLDKLMVESYSNFKKHFQKDYSFIINLFCGQYFTQIVTCDNIATSEHSENFDPFTVLTLSLPKIKKKCQLYDCLDLMISDEIIEGWKGDIIEKSRKIKKTQFLWKLPPILIIHLKRFINQYQKNNCNVKIEHQLNLQKYCKGYDSCNSEYTLYAVGNHIGNLHFGHYFADCFIENVGWYRFDDTKVSKLEKEELNSNAAYILFYKKNE